MKYKKIILLIIVGIFLLNFVSAESSYIFKQDEDAMFSIAVFNSDNSKATASTDCYFMLKDPDLNVLINDKQMAYNDSGHFKYLINDSLLGIGGEYSATVRCDDGSSYSFSSFIIEVTLRGIKITVGEAVVYGVAVLIIFGMMMACVFGIKKSDKIYMKFGLGYIAYLFLIIISYITWVTSTAMIETAFIDRFFYWIFIILTIAFIPLFFGTLAFYVYKVITLKPIMDMMKRGVPEDRAYADQIRKDMKRKGGLF